MPLLYWKGSTLSSGQNFGDLLNPFLLERRLDKHVLEKHDVLGIGTILDNRFVRDRSNVVVFGSGIGHGALPPNFSTFVPLLVRGPHTALEFGDVNLPQGDPGYLIDFERRQASGGILVPHYKSNRRLPHSWLAKRTGLRVVDVRQAPETFLAEISSARYAYVEAMHAAIACEAMRIPWKPVQLIADEPWIKWMDAIGPIMRKYVQPSRTRQSWARSDVELYFAKHLASRFGGSFDGEGAALSSDDDLMRIQRSIEHQIECFNAESWKFAPGEAIPKKSS